MEVVQQQGITVAILMQVLKLEFGVIHLTRMCDGNGAMFHFVQVIAMLLLYNLEIHL